MTSNGVLASQRAAVIANLEDDLVAIRNLAIDIDEYGDHPDSNPEFVMNTLLDLSTEVKKVIDLYGLGFLAKSVDTPGKVK